MEAFINPHHPPKKKDASAVKKSSYVPDSTALDAVLNTHKALLMTDFPQDYHIVPSEL